MDTELLIRTYPKLYHMAHLDSWPSIQKYGLLSTTALLDLFEIHGRERERLESCRRNQFEPIKHLIHGSAMIRDNKPMSDRGLQRALKGTGITPREWYEFLNRRVFFWLTEARLQTFLSAYASENHCVLTIDSHRLIKSHEARISLSSMNSGCTRPFAHARDKNVFRSIEQYPFDDFRKKKGGAKKAVVELAVEYSVPNVTNFVELVTIRNAKGIVREISHC